ncbi:MAG: SDR family NAD(P)-dependent oxidoreductase [Candidatus Hydrogenedentes bacterium]|nr:SDR family NAD(P)-dependent oxidoreductase [Candidatus Hydrogenedentota bacterium]
MRLDGATILITGASQGVGRRLAVYFGRHIEGVDILVAARNEANLRESARLVAEAGAKCSFYGCDLRESASIEKLVETIRRDGKRVNVLINNAADVTSKPLMGTSLDEIDSLVRTNVTGPLQLCRLVAPMMIERGGGAIVNISSLAGYKPNPGQTVYSATKSAVNGISDALRAEFRGTPVSVINVALSSINLSGEPRRGQVPADVFAAKLIRAIERGQPELYLSPLTKWLMRLYKFYPPLANIVRPHR